MKRKILIILILFRFGIGISQTPISLETAYEKALKNNLNLKSGQLEISYQDRIKNTYKTIEPLNISGEIGQINSAYTDNRFSINQTFRFPGFYERQKQVLLEEWKNALFSLDLQKWQLKKEISLIYNELNYQDEKQKLLERADSIYANYYRVVELRFKKGESNILEKTTAENYRNKAKIQLQKLFRDQEITLYQFNYLINDQEVYIHQKSGSFYTGLDDLGTGFSGNPLILKQLEQQKNIEKAKLSVEKAKLLPVFNIAYNNSSMYGTGADDLFYNHSKRFHSGSIGIGIPIFNTAQKSIIEGQEINQKIAQNNYEIGLRSLKKQYAETFTEYQKLKSEQDYYKTKGLENTKTILNAANQLYGKGEINYLEWTVLVNQSLEIENKYIDNQKVLNEKIIELNSLKSEN